MNLKIYKKKTIHLTLLLITATFILSGNLNSIIKYPIKPTTKNLVTSNYWLLINPIVIDDLGIQNWSWAVTQPWCTGYGNSSHPYVIENVTIDGGNSASCIEIRNSNAYFIVRNCTLFNSSGGSSPEYDAGIKLVNVSCGQIINNNCSLNNGRGIILYQSNNNNVSVNKIKYNSYGIRLSTECQNNSLSGNIVSYNANFGIRLYTNCLNNTISNNRINNNSIGIGLYYDCLYNTISGNTISNNTDGISLNYDSNNNTILENTIKHNDDEGIYLYFCDECYISRNVVDYCVNGIFFDDCKNNTISGNNVSHCIFEGIELHDNCDEIIILGNTVIDNRGDGILLGNDCNYNTISENTVNNNNNGINLQEFCHNNTISGNLASNNTMDGIELTFGDNNTFQGNTLSYNQVFGMRLHANSGTKLFDNQMHLSGLYVSGAYPSLKAMEINSSNLVNGKPIYFYVNQISLGADNFSNAGQILLFNCSYSIIAGWNVSRVSIGIYLRDCSHNTISNNTVNDNTYCGIYLDSNSNNNTITGNNASNVATNIQINGIFIKESDNNTILGNNVFNNNDHGIYLYNSLLTTLQANHIFKSGLGIENYDLLGLKTLNITTSNTVNTKPIYYHIDKTGLGSIDIYNAGQIFLINCSYSLISGQNTSRTSTGIYLHSSSHNIILNNTANDNIDSGIVLVTDCNNNTITENFVNNHATQNQDYGIYIKNGDNNTILANNASNNNMQGIFLEDCFNNTILGNTANNNSNEGISLEYCINVTISGNTLSNNSDNGINLEECKYINLYNNKMFKCGLSVSGSLLYLSSYEINISNEVNGKPLHYRINETGLDSIDINNAGQIFLINTNYSTISSLNTSQTSMGICLYYSSHNVILGNNASENIFYGIYLERSNNNTIIGNIANDNSLYGIYLYISNNNTVVENNAKENTLYGIYIESSSYVNILGNNASKNKYAGIYLKGSYKNNFERNDVSYNEFSGIEASQSITIFNNTFSRNILKKNNHYGILLPTSYYNLIYHNFFIDNGINAIDDGFYNQWDNGSVGNYWHDYPKDDDVAPFGVGDSPYDIEGYASAQDLYPLIDSPLSVNFITNITSILEGHQIQFNCTGIRENSTLTLNWFFGDGINSTDLNPSHLYLVNGVYTITLISTDIFGFSYSIIRTNYILIIENLIPLASFHSNLTEIFPGQPIQFIFDGSEGNPNATFFWDFGDGLYSTERNPVHQYQKAGNYSVKLTVTDIYGEESTQELFIVVLDSSGASTDDLTETLIIMVISLGIISAVAVSFSYVIYNIKKGTKLGRKLAQKTLRKRRKKKLSEDKYQIYKNPVKSSREILNKISNKDVLLNLFEEDASIVFERPLTIVSEDFLTTTDRIGFTTDIKEEFLREMLSFSPKERTQVVKELISDIEVVPVTKRKKREEIEDVLVYEEFTLELIQEYVEKHKTFDPNTIVPYLKSRFSRSSINVNENGIRKIMRSLIEKGIVVQGSILTKNEVLNNNNRSKVFKCIQSNPGIHLSKLVKKTSLTLAVVRWHLSVLDKFQFIKVKKVSNRVVFYDNKTSSQNFEILHFINRKKCKDIIEYLEARTEGCQLTEMARELGMHYNTLKKYVIKLEEFNLVSNKKKKIFFINKNELNKIIKNISVSGE